MYNLSSLKKLPSLPKQSRICFIVVGGPCANKNNSVVGSIKPSLLIVLFGSSVSYSSVAQSCLTLCDPMDCSMPGLPVLHQLPEPTQTHVHRVIQPSHPLSSLLLLWTSGEWRADRRRKQPTRAVVGEGSVRPSRAGSSGRTKVGIQMPVS